MPKKAIDEFLAISINKHLQQFVVFWQFIPSLILVFQVIWIYFFNSFKLIFCQYLICGKDNTLDLFQLALCFGGFGFVGLVGCCRKSVKELLEFLHSMQLGN